MYCKRCICLNPKMASNSPQSKLNRDLKKVDIPSHVKRKLLFNAAIADDVQNSFIKLWSTTKKRSFAMSVDFKYTKKYNFLTEAKPFLSCKRSSTTDKNERRRRMAFVKEVVTKFYLDDEVSCMSSNTSDQIVRKKVKKQKRFLNNLLKYTHRRFCESNEFVISLLFLPALSILGVFPAILET